MRRTIVLLLLCLVVAPAAAAAQQQTYTTPEEASKDPDFSVQGEYRGPKRAMQVIALGDGEFEAVIYQGGLPGDGWDKSPPRRLDVDEDGVADLAESNEMQRVERTSPSLGKKPPVGAVVLFDGSEESLQQHWSGGKVTKDGLLQQGVRSKDAFQDFTLHLEFRTPYKPTARGQQRGNSGVYYQGRYETQVLDSFGLEGKMNESGGIYSISHPSLNMCLPPLQWQTYDADFTAARFDASGKKTANARLTVRLNGVIVQQDVALPHATTAAPIKEGPEPGPIYLQDHKNPVVYRNIWVLPRDIEREARRPIVPGFERFYAQASQPSGKGGKLLLAELGCVNCHQSQPPGPDPQLAQRTAPVLDGVGSRVRPDYLVSYISDPHGVKPGTVMPDMLSGLSDDEREQAAVAIANYLIAESSLVDRGGNPKASRRGKDLFHNVGCTACHAPQDGTSVAAATTVPLGMLASKYTLDGLAQFLEKPHEVRKSGRMPNFGLTAEQAVDLATYLLRDAILGDGANNMRAAFFEGSWEKLPDFSQLSPYQETELYGLDILAGGRRDGFAAVFETTFVAPVDGEYRFRISSDDGSRLVVDGEPLVVNDGVHPKSTKEANVSLAAGPHSVSIEYFENGGEEVLEVEVQGGGLAWTSIESIATLDPEAKPEPMVQSEFVPQPELIQKGERLFGQLGCASCHELNRSGRAVESTLRAPALAEAKFGDGCTSGEPPRGVPTYELSVSQLAAIEAGMAVGDAVPSGSIAASFVHDTMVAMNCYACHSRNGVGGPEDTRDFVFKTTVKEMGDEGRLPPPLTGVGDKLRSEYIDAVLSNGADERPYMLVNMPGFGAGNLAGLREAFQQEDLRSEVEEVSLPVSEGKVKAAGRQLVGSKGLSCIKCHVFGNESTPGIQAIDMTRMTSRLREDWFHRYLIAPEEYRPGTRMPASFKDGKSAAAQVLDGVPEAQTQAMWQYLLDGEAARKPEGVGKQPIELIAESRPVIYRNFISGLSPRAIAVGYPEQGNLAWDAEAMALSVLWKGSFIDASKHWQGRGPGKQGPLGDEILTFEQAVPVAVLPAVDAAWPTGKARENGYRFIGYRLDASGRPVFRYAFAGITVEDAPVPTTDPETTVRFQRSLNISSDEGSPARNGPVVFRAAVGKQIKQLQQGWFDVDGKYTIRVPGASVVQVGDAQELRLVVSLQGAESVVEEVIRW